MENKRKQYTELYNKLLKEQEASCELTEIPGDSWQMMAIESLHGWPHVRLVRLGDTTETSETALCSVHKV